MVLCMQSHVTKLSSGIRLPNGTARGGKWSAVQVARLLESASMDVVVQNGRENKC
jgi:hypothetical protein